MPPVDHTLSKPGSSTERVIAAVLGQIATGALLPGEQLRQEEVADQLGVSRVPVREALYALAEQGVLLHQKHRGFFVTKRNAGELAQIARLLELVGQEVIDTIEWPDAETIERLRALNARMRELANASDLVETSQLNTEFHFMIFRLSPKTIIVDELERLWRLAHPYIITEMATPAGRRRRLAEHEEIIAHLAARDHAGVVAWHAAHRRRGGDLADAVPATTVREGHETRSTLQQGTDLRADAARLVPAVIFRSIDGDRA